MKSGNWIVLGKSPAVFNVTPPVQWRGQEVDKAGAWVDKNVNAIFTKIVK